MRNLSHRYQPVPGFLSLRSLAWCELELYSVGSSAWHVFSTGAWAPRQITSQMLASFPTPLPLVRGNDSMGIIQVR